MKRRAFIGFAAAAGAGAVGYGGWVEPHLLEVERHPVRLSARGALAAGATPQAPGTPPQAGSEPIRIVQLSDLHLVGLDDFHASLAREVDALAPDLLVLTGDTIDDRRNLPLAGEFLSLLRARVPTLAVLGNWEYQGGVPARALSRELGRADGVLLVNRTERLRPRGRELLVTGVDDWLRGAPDVQRALSEASGAAREAGHHLVLAHCPVHRDVIGADSYPGPTPPWVLCGHTHGGQVGVPGLRYTPRGSGEYVRGWYRGPLPHAYVSRGLGTSVVPLRIGSRPELAFFDVHLS